MPIDFRLTRNLLAVLAASAVPVVAAARPDLPEDITLYAGGDLTFQFASRITSGGVVAGGNIAHQGNLLYADSLMAGGGFTAQPAAFQLISGDVLFNGDIVGFGGPGSYVGSVTSTQGSIDFLDTSLTVNGDVSAQGDVELRFSFSQFNGNVTAGGAIDITGTVAGSIHPGTSPNLPAFSPAPLPAGSMLTPGTQDITLSHFEDLTLAPGAYGTLAFANSNTVTLSSGSYVFQDITSSFNLNRLVFDTSGGAIDIYIASEDFTFDMIQEVGGGSTIGANPPHAQAAHDVFLEAAGDVTLGSTFYGTVFAPHGDLTLEHAVDIVGRAYAGGDVSLFNSDVGGFFEGDVNGDGTVNAQDLDFILAHWGQAVQYGDLDGDGLIGQADLAQVIAHWPGNALPAGSVAPEPGSAIVLLGLSVFSLRRRGR
ncbi:MAG: dockerin type I repeat-containing protein [Phycisphaerales bacterium JB063]